jgi:hypothetical protein
LIRRNSGESRQAKEQMLVGIFFCRPPPFYRRDIKDENQAGAAIIPAKCQVNGAFLETQGGSFYYPKREDDLFNAGTEILG